MGERTQHTVAAFQAVKAIPPAKRPSKIARTVVGVLFGALDYYGAEKLHWEPKYVIGLAVFAGIVAAGELVTFPVKLAIGLVRDLVAALNPGSGGGA